MTKKQDAAVRHEQILAEAMNQAKRVGYTNITREAIAAAAGVSVGMINTQFGTMAALKRDVIRAAVKRRVPEIIAQGLVMKDPHALRAPEDLKAAARASIKI